MAAAFDNGAQPFLCNNSKLNNAIYMSLKE